MTQCLQPKTTRNFLSVPPVDSVGRCSEVLLYASTCNSAFPTSLFPIACYVIFVVYIRIKSENTQRFKSHGRLVQYSVLSPHTKKAPIKTTISVPIEQNINDYTYARVCLISVRTSCSC